MNLYIYFFFSFFLLLNKKKELLQIKIKRSNYLKAHLFQTFTNFFLQSIYFHLKKKKIM